MTDFQNQDSYAGFQKFKEKVNFLQKLYSDTEKIFLEINQPSDAQTLHKSCEKLKSDSFKVLVIGEFKRGKSTFLNALMGKEILPAYAIPCTAVINEIKWSKDTYAILHFENPLPKEIPFKLAPDVQKHLDKYKGKEVPPMKIPSDRLEEFVKIPDPGKDHAESVFESPFKLVELYYPLEICRNNIDLIDSPGLNEHKSRTNVTVNYLEQADAIIFVLSSGVPCSMSEMDVIDNTLRANDHEDIFFVVNRFDAIRERDKGNLIAFTKDKLLNKTSLGERGLHFVSSLYALDAKLDNDSDLLKKSGFPELEKDLNDFLFKNRGRIKILHPANLLRRLIAKGLQDAIPQQLDMLSSESQVLERRYNEAKPKIKEAENSRDRFLRELKLERQNFRREVVSEVKSFLWKIAEEIPAMLNNYEIKAKFKFVSWMPTKEQAEKIKNECLEFITQQTERLNNEWQEKTFKPRINSFFESISDIIRTDIEGVSDELNNVRRIVSGSNNGLGRFRINIDDILSTRLTPKCTAALLLEFLEVTTGFRTILKYIFKMPGNRVGEAIKKQIIKDLQKSIKEKSEKIPDKIADRVQAEIQVMLDSIDSAIQDEIQNIQNSVESILKTTKSGKEEIERKRTTLTENREHLKELQTKLDDFFMDEI